MEPVDAAYSFSKSLVDGLVAMGVRHACVSPGSRNTPLTMAVAAHHLLDDRIHLDERSAAFWALGMAKATGVPVLLVCTSGTAAAEYLPALVEARLSRVPLIALTADRPPELRDVGAPQTIDQTRLYGTAAKWSHDSGVPDAATVDGAAALAAHLWAEAVDRPAGPVHLNVPFRDPLTRPGVTPHAGRDASTGAVAYRPGRLQLSEHTLAEVGEALTGKRLLIVCGEEREASFAESCVSLAVAAAAPVLADPLSGLRSGSHGPPVIRRGDLLAGAGFLDRLQPEAVLRFGSLPTSKALWTWLEAHPEIPQILVDAAGWRDPLASASMVLRSDAVAAAQDLTKVIGSGPGSWLETWVRADETAGSAAHAVLEAEPFPNEPMVAALVTASLPPGSILYVASSMPIRDIDTFATPGLGPVTYLANRGANGIDGLLSSSFGASQATGRPTYALAGDLSALHDLTALAAGVRLGIPVTVVVVDNDGGGIFHFLSQADPAVTDPTVFERYFGTSHGTDFIAVASALGLEARSVTTPAELVAAVSTPPEAPNLVHVRTHRSANVDVHRRVRDAVAAALG